MLLIVNKGTLMSDYIPQILPLSKYYNIDTAVFEKLEILNIPLTIDAPLFIDPQLLKDSKYSIFSNTAWKKYKLYYEDLYSSILAYTNLNEKVKKHVRKGIIQKLQSKEQKGLCLGYSISNTRGRGIGPAKANQILDSALRIIEHGATGPDMFSVIFLLEEGIGADCISDLTAKIIQEELCAFTEFIAKKLKIQTYTYPIKGKRYNLPKHPKEKNSYLLFVPLDIVNKLPTATNLRDIMSNMLSQFGHLEAQDNATLRFDINQQIIQIWRDANINKNTDAETKSILKKFVYENPNAVDALTRAVNTTTPRPFNINTDLAGYNIPAKFDKYFDNKYLPNRQTTSKLEYLDSIVHGFANLVSCDNVLKRNLLYTNLKPRNEYAWQSLFRCYTDVCLKQVNLDISPEAQTGRGPIDFKISEGADFKVLIEIKLSRNPNYIAGLTKQLKAYEQATENVKRAYYIYIDLEEDDKHGQDKVDKLLQAKNKSGSDAKIIIVDGRIQPSASKLH